jgi:hypothetical protein
MKTLSLVAAVLSLAACATAMETNGASEPERECCEMNGPYNDTVGIRQVTHNGVKLEAAMRLEISGGTISTVVANDGVKTYKLDLEAYESAINAQISSLSERVVALEAQLEAATADNTAGTLVKRDVNGDIFTSNFRGNLKEAANGGFVKIINYGGQEVVRFGQNGSDPGLRFFDGGTLVLQQTLSESDPNLATSTANALGQFGFVTVTP